MRSTHKDPKTAYRYLQEHLNLLAEYYKLWKLKVNGLKSETILFTRNRLVTTLQPLQFESIPIRRVMSVKYLGITIQHNLKFNEHCMNVIKQAKSTWTKLWPLVGLNSSLNAANKVTMYKLYARSILTYNIQIWNDISKTNMKKLQSFQNKCLRHCLSLRPHPVTFKQVPTTVVHILTRSTSVMAYSVELKNKFINSCKLHANLLIKSFFPH